MTPQIARTLRAEQLTASVRVQNPFARTFIVPSQTDAAKSYRVNLAAQTCTCPDFHFRGVTCKHMLAAQRAERKAHAAPALKLQPKTYAVLFIELGI